MIWNCDCATINMARQKYMKLVLNYCSISKLISLNPLQRVIGDEDAIEKKILLEGTVGTLIYNKFFEGLKNILSNQFNYIYIESFETSIRKLRRLIHTQRQLID